MSMPSDNTRECSQPSELFDVIATEIATGKTRVIASGVSARNAEAIVEMAVIRRGVETEFYAPVPRQGGAEK